MNLFAPNITFNSTKIQSTLILIELYNDLKLILTRNK